MAKRAEPSHQPGTNRGALRGGKVDIHEDLLEDIERTLAHRHRRQFTVSN